jgi:hypothetical protein
MLENIDRLSELVDLPQMVVVGDQSSSKSSVLEGLVRKPLPRSLHALRHPDRLPQSAPAANSRFRVPERRFVASPHDSGLCTRFAPQIVFRRALQQQVLVSACRRGASLVPELVPETLVSPEREGP